ncbi:MAG: alpha/beta fold hydrolase [Chloroflexota bacterium]
MSSKTFVLVHGAWGASFNWFPIIPSLAAAEHRHYMISHTGHGERRHLSGPHITLSTHIADVVNLIEMFDLHDIYLVGHSYGGMVITGVWDRVRERVKHVVYVDAFVPENGKCLHDYAPPDRVKWMLEQAAQNNGMIPFLGVAAGREPTEWHMPQSLATFREPLLLTRGELPSDVPKTYCLATENKPSAFHHFAGLVKDDPTWDYHEFETGHNIMAEATDAFTELLIGL